MTSGEPRSGEGDFRLEATQDIRDCTAMVRLLSEKLASANVLGIDASFLVTGDITLVQTLIAARKSAERQGGRMAVAATGSDTLVNLFERCGVAPETEPLFTNNAAEQAHEQDGTVRR